ncbi:MAG: hypothetical protein OEW94_11090 [Betaproteobacteria bacterium]|nr:hypothetical protein [Betaproteobacteria bacterium]MDH5351240.1 hypothetical protein [Betaproteobacteria bacterium]
MHDGISLETLGVPAAVIVTSTFVHEARVQREALGMQGIVPVVIDHPLSSISDEEIRGRAAQALAQVIGVWRGTQPDPA